MRAAISASSTISPASGSGYGPIAVFHSSMSPTGTVRREAAFLLSRKRLVAMRWSQVRVEARPSNRSRARQARRNVSCTRSSASATLPVSR